jgi:hypothetical protein
MTLADAAENLWQNMYMIVSVHRGVLFLSVAGGGWICSGGTYDKFVVKSIAVTTNMSYMISGC